MRGWSLSRHSLLRQHGNRLTFQIPSNKLQVSITYNCIVNETNQTATAYDALVVPSNQWMSGNANKTAWWFNGRLNVDGKVREASGIELTQLIQQMKRDTPLKANQLFLPPGTVRVTTAPNLKIHHLLHTVGPSTTSTSKSDESELERTYTTCLAVAESLHVQSLLMPAISTGVFRMPFELSARAAIRALEKVPPKSRQMRINFVLLERAGAGIFADEFNTTWNCIT